MAPNPKTALWFASGAYDLLDEYLTDGTIPINKGLMKPKVAYQLSACFTANEYEYFRAKLCNRRNKFEKGTTVAAKTDAALERDYQLHPPSKYTSTGKLKWNGSAAQVRLRIDLSPYLKKKAQDRRYEPRHLYASRTEYQEFTLAEFRGHIYTERKARKFANYLKHKKEKHRAMMLKEFEKVYVNNSDSDSDESDD